MLQTRSTTPCWLSVVIRRLTTRGLYTRQDCFWGWIFFRFLGENFLCFQILDYCFGPHVFQTFSFNLGKPGSVTAFEKGYFHT